MPSFKEAIGVITTLIILATASGHGDKVWPTLIKFRFYVLKESKKDWGCPSIFNKSACRQSSYDSP